MEGKVNESARAKCEMRVRNASAKCEMRVQNVSVSLHVSVCVCEWEMQAHGKWSDWLAVNACQHQNLQGCLTGPGDRPGQS